LDASGEITETLLIYAGGAAGYTLRAMYDINADGIKDMVWTRDFDARTVCWLLDNGGAITEYMTVSAGGSTGWVLIDVLAPSS